MVSFLNTNICRGGRRLSHRASRISGGGTPRKSGRRTRQNDPEQASTRRVVCELNVPAVRLNRPASDREAQPYAAVCPGTASVDAIEAIENTLAMHCGDSRPSVLYLDHCLVRTPRIQTDGDRAANRRVFYCIVNQIGEGMAHERGVSKRVNRDRNTEREILLLFVGQHPELINYISC